MTRLFCVEASELARSDEFTEIQHFRRLAGEVARGACSIDELAAEPLGDEVVTRVRDYGKRLHICGALGNDTTVEEIAQLVSRRRGEAAVFIDYLQKIPEVSQDESAISRTNPVAEQLKEIAMRHVVAVIAIAATDRSGLDARRLHLQHLGGTCAIAHEADIAIVMNEKSAVVAKSHLAFDSVRAETFSRKVVLSIEKNRGGPSGLDLEFEKDLANFRFLPNGGFVNERLIDEVLVLE